MFPRVSGGRRRRKGESYLRSGFPQSKTSPVSPVSPSTVTESVGSWGTELSSVVSFSFVKLCPTPLGGVSCVPCVSRSPCRGEESRFGLICVPGRGRVSVSLRPVSERTRPWMTKRRDDRRTSLFCVLPSRPEDLTGSDSGPGSVVDCFLCGVDLLCFPHTECTSCDSGRTPERVPLLSWDP